MINATWDRWLLTGAAWLVLAGCPACILADPGSEYAAPKAICQLQDERIVEASGIVASRRNEGYFYVHNDSGGAAEVYVIDRQGRTRATLRLTGAKNRDWEDIALAPSQKPHRFDVVVADIGDNDSKWSRVTLYRFQEPDLQGVVGVTLDVQPTVLEATYADGPTDAEAIAFHPMTGEGYIFSKRLDGQCRVYRIPAEWPTGAEIKLDRIGELAIPVGIPLGTVVTAADISPDGRRLAVRTYACGWEWVLPMSAEMRDFPQVFGEKPTRIQLAAEPQGEAICYSDSGQSLLTVSEKRPTTLYEALRE